MSGKDPWHHPLRDLRLKLTKAGRARLAVKRRLAGQVRDMRHAVELARLSDVAEADRRGIQAAFLKWDDEETARIREETVDDLADLYPDLSRPALRRILDKFAETSRDLPVEREAPP